MFWWCETTLQINGLFQFLLCCPLSQLRIWQSSRRLKHLKNRFFSIYRRFTIPELCLFQRGFNLLCHALAGWILLDQSIEDFFCFIYCFFPWVWDLKALFLIINSVKLIFFFCLVFWLFLDGLLPEHFFMFFPMVFTDIRRLFKFRWYNLNV